MTCALVTPWWRSRMPDATAGAELAGSAGPTRTLDWNHPRIGELLARLPADAGDVELLRAAHQLVAARVRPVYALDDAQPASRTLRRGRGSCSQRLAVVEAVARASGVPTRVRGLVVDGSFW